MSAIITAHSGSDGTPDNSLEFVRYALSCPVEALEVDVRVRPEKSGVLCEKSLHGEPDMKLPGDKQRGIDPDMPDAGGRAGKTQKS